MRNLALNSIGALAILMAATFAHGAEGVSALAEKNNATISAFISEMREHGLIFVGITETVRVESSAGTEIASASLATHALALRSLGISAVYRDEMLGGYRVVTSSGIESGKLQYVQKGIFVPGAKNPLAGAESVQFEWRDGSQMKLQRAWREWYGFVYQSNAP